jgi:hypothetical protein
MAQLPKLKVHSMKALGGLSRMASQRPPAAKVVSFFAGLTTFATLVCLLAGYREAQTVFAIAAVSSLLVYALLPSNKNGF